MATRSCREKAQKLNEQHQLILSKLLREEDNKYCADCEAKGPRWASWNIGVFICIRCAGIHRNLGVHISRVKSVNLDQWTPEQIQCMQDMGNTKARLLYEANLPENFRRPQTDQAVEFFIRDKYEKKKYYDKNAIAITNISSSDAPLQPLVSSPSLQAAVEKNKLEKEKEKKKEEKKKEKEPEKPTKPLTTEKCVCDTASPQQDLKMKRYKLQKKEDQQLEPKKSTSPKKAAEPTVDLLGLDGPAEAPVTNGNATTVPSLNDDLDIFGPMISNPLPATVVPPAQGTPSIPAAATLSTVISGDLDLFTEQTTKSEEVAKKQLSKDSILSLYGTGTIQQQSTPGVFMGPTNIPFTSQAPTAFQGFPSMGVPVPTPAAPGLLGNVMGQSASMMVGMPMPNGFMGNAQTSVMPLPPNVVGPQGGMMGQMGAPQSKFGLPQAQQPQWNLSQMNQQMAGMSISSTTPTVGFGQPPNTTAGWSGSSSGQTLSTQLWK
ncbi:stromal membrane-associated protein 1 isoform X1 [Mustela putorius furo]|uniref:Stromal membrane-associated protein 1 isoform X1 n=3 Tax=Mustela putorius furo TaxID=9669 RepID=A0A8U0T8Q0_MUSPF|nr:stromal membrane-associated protein 1 isoform X1 [Mustela putorius furo]